MIIAPGGGSGSEAARLESAAQRVLSANALGRSEPILKLFAYLLAGSLAGDTVREIDVATEVFGRDDIGQDSTVRVYVHRLRRKLEEYYTGAGRHEIDRVAITKGSYRLELEAVPQDAAAVAASSGAAPGEAYRHWALLVLFFGLLNLGAWWWLGRSADLYAPVRQKMIWSSLLANGRPISVVIGDYYIFGETDNEMVVRRLVREFDVNSREGLYEFLMTHPDKADRYVDLDLRYLPISVAPALNAVLPVLHPPSERAARVRVLLASALTPDIMKSDNVVYIGYLSGLGPLRDATFAGSRFAVGDTFDELIDTKSKQKYVSDIGSLGDDSAPKRYYGYLATFAGPDGNRFIVIAGTRDVAIRHIAEQIVNPDALDNISDNSLGARDYEALFGVEGMQQQNLSATLISASPLDTTKIWTGSGGRYFPAD